jgi:hypothetical protein
MIDFQKLSGVKLIDRIRGYGYEIGTVSNTGKTCVLIGISPTNANFIRIIQTKSIIKFLHLGIFRMK